MSAINPDLNEVIDTILSLTIDPYRRFIEKLRIEGRISDAEIAELNEVVKVQRTEMSKLIQDGLTDET
ncbi:hypothetical protein W02_24860 [Nitrospira sp. KM1]|uniref:hypothetical protein n=1 Tax=Nitrospira sp. KM1 TaxID=1936990 RepID=UPI0013A78740|nr:hypothetical protein [Nitrospira sp. KM1]BCA55346.1 hypothetical protein W02_24860 [Nitrospira sp. KM1]